MITSKPFATISYNTVPFLKNKLNDLYNKCIIDFACFVVHKAEEDELKEHIHLYIVPSSRCDTRSLMKEFDEIEIGNDKPLRCLPCTSSKFGDWYQYSTHDPVYLAKKGHYRKYQYHKSKFFSTDVEHFNELIAQIDRSELTGLRNFISAVDSGISFGRLVRNGQVPIQLLGQYKNAYDIIKTVAPNPIRNGRKTHTPKLEELDLACDENGEILECPFDE